MQKQSNISKQQSQIVQKCQHNSEEIKNIEKIIKTYGINLKRNHIYILGSQLNSQKLGYILKLQNCINYCMLIQLNLGQNKIDDQGIRILTNQRFEWKKLQKLQLFKNNISMKGFEYLSKAIQSKRIPQLKLLNISQNKIGCCSSFKQFQKQNQEGLFLKFANNNTKLQFFFLSKNNINDEDMKIFFQTKQNTKKVFSHLKAIFLWNNKIKDQGIKALVGQNIQFPLLSTLSLETNQINVKGIKNLVSYKNKNTFFNIQELYLDNNIFIGDKGIYELMRGSYLGTFPKLQFLSIPNINLSDIGIESIIKLYDQPKSLKHLNQIDAQKNTLLVTNKKAFKKLEKRFNSKVKSVKI